MDTDKSIIIDGCNVAECEFYTNLKMDCSLMPLQNLACSKNPNCYFKQLQRAKAEKKQSQEQLQNLWANATAERIKLETENERLKKALEEIKEMVKKYDAEVRDTIIANPIQDCYDIYLKINEVLNEG